MRVSSFRVPLSSFLLVLAMCAGMLAMFRPVVAHAASAALDDAQKLYDAVGSKVKNIKIFDVEEGGAEHCHVDNRQVGIDYVGDWLAKHL